MLRIFKGYKLQIENKSGKKIIWEVIDVSHKSSGKESVNPQWTTLWELKIQGKDIVKEVCHDDLEKLYNDNKLSVIWE
jgi:hypothetical protein